MNLSRRTIPEIFSISYIFNIFPLSFLITPWYDDTARSDIQLFHFPLIYFERSRPETNWSFVSGRLFCAKRKKAAKIFRLQAGRFYGSNAKGAPRPPLSHYPCQESSQIFRHYPARSAKSRKPGPPVCGFSTLIKRESAAYKLPCRGGCSEMCCASTCAQAPLRSRPAAGTAPTDTIRPARS